MEKCVTDKTSDIANFMPLKNNFTSHEVALFFSCSQSTIKRLCRNGEISAYKIGKIWRISRASLVEYISLNTDRGKVLD